MHAAGMARWGNVYLHCDGSHRSEQKEGRFPAAWGMQSWWQVGADSFQWLSQFLQPDSVPPSNPKLSGCCLKHTLLLRPALNGRLPRKASKAQYLSWQLLPPASAAAFTANKLEANKK